MGKISRIQLRGISRTPSDRLTEDGGCAESLNVSLDHSELAPSFIPEDLTKKLGLPNDLQAEKVFLHKMSGKETVIVIKGNEVQAWEQGNVQEVCELDEGEEVNDVASIGNTIVITTTKRPIYILYKDGRYKLLGNSIPMPTVEFFDKQTDIYHVKKYDNDNPALGEYGMDFLYPEALRSPNAKVQVLSGRVEIASYEEETDKVKVGLEQALWNQINAQEQNANEVARTMVSELKAMYDDMKRVNIDEGVLINPVWVMYGVRLYDGSLKMSVPYLLSGGVESPVDIYARGGEYASVAFYFVRLNHYYKLGIRLHDFFDYEIEPWKDIVKGIDVYMSEDINAQDWKAVTIKERTLDENGNAFVKMEISGLKGSYMNYAMSCTTFSKVAEFAIDQSFYPSGATSIDAIREDFIIDMKGKMLNEDRVNTNSLLSDEEYEFASGTYTGKSEVFNNRLIVSDLHKDMSSGPRWLLSQRYNPYLPIPRITGQFASTTYPAWWEKNLPDESEIPITHYRFVYHINDQQGGEAIVYGRTAEENAWFAMVYDRYYQKGIRPLAFLLAIYPDHNCKTVDIRNEKGLTRTYPMSPHPYLPNCSIVFGPEMNGEMEAGTQKDMPSEQKRFSIPNRLGVSQVNNPLLFTPSSFYTFQSKVLGIAIASTALSQGQFGQYPLYVFTEDGIWAMETAADGSFVTSKPLSRDVCINPDSITSIDNAVIFVTDKGVMLLQGSQVVNISPNMNGRHYQIENSVRTIIENQDFFCDLLPALSDNTHFLAFVKGATVAYDYAGRRLIFIKKDEKYQYVYKLDTQTWHKGAYGIKLVAPINSYPECLVQGAENAVLKKLWVTRYESQNSWKEIAADLQDRLEFLSMDELELFLTEETGLDVTGWDDIAIDIIWDTLADYRVSIEQREESILATRIYNFSTVLDTENTQPVGKGIIATRPFDLGEPDVFKTITDIRIRGQFPKGAVKFILLGSNDGINFATVSTLRGRAWKLFRMVILADLAPTERISWVDIMYDTKFTNKLR